MIRGAALLLVLFFAQDDGAIKLKWKVAKSDFVRYKAWNYTPPDEKPNATPSQRVAGIFGYEIKDDTRYEAQPKDDRDVPLQLCFTLPKPLAVGATTDFSVDFDAFNYGAITVKGTTTRNKNATIQGAGCVEFVHKAKLSAKGKGTGTQIDGGAFDAVVHFDPAIGVVRRVRFSWSWSYSYENADKKKQTYTQAQNEIMEYVKTLQVRTAEFEMEVNKAIDKGIEAIWKVYDDKEGHWAVMGEHKTGQTALALLAILKGTLDRSDARLRKALDWMIAQPLEQTYDVGLCLMAMEAFYSPKDPTTRFKPGEIADKEIVKNIEKPHLAWATSAAKWLLANQQPSGMWHYPMKDIASADYSNTQYGVLGLLAAARIGVGVDLNAVMKALRSYLDSQMKTGTKTELLLTEQNPPKGTKPTTSGVVAEVRGWGYGAGAGTTGYGSMTLGGIGSLTILDSILRRAGAKYTKDEAGKVIAARRDGWAWMQSNWTVKSNAAYGSSWYCYYLYAMERAAMLMGVATIGGHDWYWEGAEILISNQSDAGTWWNSSVYDTCFCVLFLKRATFNVATPTGK